MKRIWIVGVMLLLLGSLAMGASTSASTKSDVLGTGWKFLSPLRNAQYVYVTSYDGSQFAARTLPEDRQAISTAEDALQKWHYTIVYRPEEADMIVAVKSWPSEDLLAVYTRQSWREGSWLWRASGKNGLTAPNEPLLQQLKAGLVKIKAAPLADEQTRAGE